MDMTNNSDITIDMNTNSDITIDINISDAIGNYIRNNSCFIVKVISVDININM
jgi:hypothetical protein